MPKKSKHLDNIPPEEIQEMEEPFINNDDNDVDEELKNEIVEVPDKPKTKPKRQMTEAQKEALAKGRQMGWEKLKQKHEIANTKKAVNKEIKKIQEETNVKEIEDLKKIADVSTVNNKVDKLYNRFDEINSTLTQLLEMKKKKQDNKYQHEIKKEIKNQAREVVIKNTMKPYNRWAN